jgi:hypothetical protein
MIEDNALRCACGERVKLIARFDGGCEACCPAHGIVASGIAGESGQDEDRQVRTARENCLRGLAAWNAAFKQSVDE